MKKATHRHSGCSCSKDLSHIIQHAETQTRLKGERFTPLRKEIIETLVKAGKPVGAYDLLKMVNAGRKKKISAMSLYRVLDYLQALGLAIKLESKNTYMPCHHEGHDHGHVIIVCDDCGSTQEVEDQAINTHIHKLAEKNRLKIQHNVIELHGLCSHCQ